VSYSYPQSTVELRILPEDFHLVSKATDTPYKIHVVARTVTINVNDYKTTDTFSMEIDYKHFPFDPRLIRSCGVVIFLQDMKSLVKDDGSPNTIVPGAPTDLNSTIPNSVFIGFVDDESIEFDDSKRCVRFEGRDCTGLLIDQKYLANTPIPLSSRLDYAIFDLLQQNPATQNISLVAGDGPDGQPLDFADLPTLAQYYPDFGSPLAGQRNTGAHESYWEIIQDLVARAGLICYMGTGYGTDGNIVPAIVLTTPKNQHNDSDDIKFIYAINVKNLKLKRKLGRFKGFNIQVRSRVEKEVLIAKIPEEATVDWGVKYGFQYDAATVPSQDANLVAIGHQNFDPITVPVLKPDGSLDASTTHLAPYITFNVKNISNKDALIKIGETVFEQYSLQTLEGSLETMEMAGRGSNKGAGVDNYNSGKQYDLTHIKKGQTICMEINTEDLTAISRFASVGSRVSYLLNQGYDRATANVFAQVMGKFSPRFQIKSYSMTLNQDTGFKLSMQFQSIIDLGNISLE